MWNWEKEENACPCVTTHATTMNCKKWHHSPNLKFPCPWRRLQTIFPSFHSLFNPPPSRHRCLSSGPHCIIAGPCQESPPGLPECSEMTCPLRAVLFLFSFSPSLYVLKLFANSCFFCNFSTNPATIQIKKKKKRHCGEEGVGNISFPYAYPRSQRPLLPLHYLLDPSSTPLPFL